MHRFNRKEAETAVVAMNTLLVCLLTCIKKKQECLYCIAQNLGNLAVTTDPPKL